MQYDRSKFDQFKVRKADRVRVDFEAFLTFENKLERPVVITDFSTSGFSCRSTEPLAIGSHVMLQIPTMGQFTAKIVWQLGDNAGAHFDPPLPVSCVMSIILAAVHQQRAIQNSDVMGDSA
jgi:hypothetical protein